MPGLRQEIVDCLAEIAPGSRVVPIAGDASTRTFYRVLVPGAPSRVLMDYGAPFDAETDDEILTRIFRDAGLRVAQVLDRSGRAGCLLLEDLGERTLESALTGSSGALRPEARELVERAVKLAARVAVDGSAAIARSDRRLRPVLDAHCFRFEMDFFIKHYVRGLLRRERAPQGLREALHALAEAAAAGPRVLCHRDYHSRNLMLLENGELAMVDIQDARWGPDSYDLASLLSDAYVDLDTGWDEALIELYCSELDRTPAAGFRKRLERVSAQRMIKALGTFGYQTTVRGKKRYLGAVPRTLQRLRRLLPEPPETQALYERLTTDALLDDL